MVLTTSADTRLADCSACLDSVSTAALIRASAAWSFGRNSFFSATKKASGGATVTVCASAGAGITRVSVSAMLGLRRHGPLGVFIASRGCSVPVGRSRQCLHQGRILQELRQQVLGPSLAVHVAEEVRQLLASLEQLTQRRHLPRDRVRQEVVQALEREVDRQLPLTGQGVLDPEGGAGPYRSQPVVEIVDVDLQKLALRECGLRLLGLPGKVGQDAHDKRQLDLLFRAVGL